MGLSQRVIGQEEAVGAVSKAVKRARTGLNDPQKPLGGFLFLGPTGVGKTELSKALANYLFDEVEKAHPDVFNILLQVLDDGRLTDNHGNLIDFKNTIIILTSNLGSDQTINNAIEKEAMRSNVMGIVRKFFRPEFLNRLDEIIIFNNLPKDSMKEIVKIQINELKERLLEKNITLCIEDSGINWLANKGYDPSYGARPLKRLIQKEIQDKIAEGILSGKILEGNEVSVSLENENLVFKNN